MFVEVEKRTGRIGESDGQDGPGLPKPPSIRRNEQNGGEHERTERKTEDQS
jgi:hypothetical protein